MNHAPPDSIPARTARALLRAVRDSGHSVDDALRHCGLPARLADTDDAGHVSTLAYSRLYRYVIDLLQDEAFGLNTRQKMPPGTFRMMCLFIIHCRTLRAALGRAAEFFHFCRQFLDANLPPPEPLLPGETPGSVIIVLGTPQADAASHPGADASMIYMMLNFYSWLIDSPLPATAILLAHPPPAAAQRYEALFRAPLRFAAACNGLEIPAECLDMPLAQNEDTLRDFLRSAPYPLIQPHNPQRRQHPLAQRIRECLGRNLHEPATTLASIAQQLGLTPRTVHRKLAAEGTSFRALKESVLKETALHYLANPDLSVDAIATLMGFRESSAFYRSFRRWTGQAPGQYRITHGIVHKP